MSVVYYAVTKALDPATGDYKFSGSVHTRGSPMREIIIRILRTPKGQCLANPNFGIDLSLVRKQFPNTAQNLKNSISQSVKYLVDQNLISNLEISVDSDTSTSTLKYQISFTDNQANNREIDTIKGRF